MRQRPRARPRARLILAVDPTDEEWTPAQKTGGGILPEHWYRSDGPLWQDAGVTPAVADGDPVGRWEDKTAFADHLTQNTAGLRPTLQNEAGDKLNNHPVIRCDGADDRVSSSWITGGNISQPNVTFIVAKLDASIVNDGSYHHIFDSYGSTRQILRTDTPSTPDSWQIRAGTNLAGTTPSDANWHIWTVLFNGANSKFWKDGVLEAAGDAGTYLTMGACLGTDNAGGNPFKGDYAEALYYDANLSTADMNQVGQYLAQRYGLTYTDII